MATYLEQSLEKLTEFEGSVPWMYLDTVGRVTVGVGAMLGDVLAAVQLPFLLAGKRASQEEIAAEFARVGAMRRGMLPSAYRLDGGLELTAETIGERLRDTLAGFEQELERHLPCYAGLPDAAKLALLDMSFNLGPSGLLLEYPRLLAAVAAGRWTDAAGECLRGGISAKRNAWTRLQLLSAAASGAVEVIRAFGARSGRWIGWMGAGLGFAIAGGLVVALWRRGRKRRKSVLLPPPKSVVS